MNTLMISFILILTIMLQCNIDRDRLKRLSTSYTSNFGFTLVGICGNDAFQQADCKSEDDE